MSDDLTAFSDEAILRELVLRNDTLPAPTHREPAPAIEVLVGIGKDHSCFIAFYPEAFAELTKGTRDE